MSTALIILVILICLLSTHTWLCTKFDIHVEPHDWRFYDGKRSGECPRCGTHVIQRDNGRWMNNG